MNLRVNNPSPLILTLPGWQNSGAAHWQSRWEALHGYQRVQQHNWLQPLRGDWTARLQEVVVDSPKPVVLVAHSLGCILTAWWAAHSPHAHRVRAALLVAPGDVERDDAHVPLRSWAPIARQPLPFPALVVASRNDPFCSLERAQQMAADWGARCVDAGNGGHLNADSDLGDWPQGQAWLHSLLADLKD